jgi:hypothetical protein
MAELENHQATKARGADAQRKPRSTMARWSTPPVLPKPEECLRLARVDIRRTQLLLTDASAESLLRSEVYISQVADRLRQFQRSFRRSAGAGDLDREALRAMGAEVKDELLQAYASFQRITQYYAHWIQVYSARRCGYTRTGSPARLTCQFGRKPVQG